MTCVSALMLRSLKYRIRSCLSGLQGREFDKALENVAQARSLSRLP